MILGGVLVPGNIDGGRIKTKEVGIQARIFGHNFFNGKGTGRCKGDPEQKGLVAFFLQGFNQDFSHHALIYILDIYRPGVDLGGRFPGTLEKGGFPNKLHTRIILVG